MPTQRTTSAAKTSMRGRSDLDTAAALAHSGHLRRPSSQRTAATRSRPGVWGCDPTRPGADAGVAARARLLPAIAAGERVAGDALVSPDEHVPVDAAPTKAEARGRGKRVRVHGVAVGRVRVAWSHSRSGEEGGRPEGQASLGEGWSGERDEHEGPENDHEGLHHRLSNTLARWARPSACGILESYGKDRAGLLVQEPEGRGGGRDSSAINAPCADW